MKEVVEERDETILKLKNLEKKYKDQQEEKTRLREYYERSLYITTPAMDRMKQEMTENDIKFAGERDKAERLREYYEDSVHIAIPTMDRMKQEIRKIPQNFLCRQRTHSASLYKKD